MTQFQYLNGGNTEAQDKLATSFLLQQTSTVGKAVTGVLSGLKVSQTTTASGSVLVGAGAGVVQAATLDGADVLVNDSQATVDVFTANPMSSLPRNDIIVFDTATIPNGLRPIIGTPNATPTDPTIPASCIPLARLRQIASGQPGSGTIPSSVIDDLRTYTGLFGTLGPTVVSYFPADFTVPSAGYKKRLDTTASEALGGGTLVAGHRHTVDRDGLYLISAEQRITHNADYFVTFEARKNDSGSGADGTLLFADYSYVKTSAGVGASPGFSVRKRLVAGDYVDFFVTVDATGAIIRGGDAFSQCSVEWIRA